MPADVLRGVCLTEEKIVECVVKRFPEKVSFDRMTGKRCTPPICQDIHVRFSNKINNTIIGQYKSKLTRCQ